MTSRLSPYLSFRDTAREAMTFYQEVFGGELTISTFGEFHASDDPSEADKVMHSQLTTSSGYVFMGADTPNSMEYSRGTDVSLSLSGEAADKEELTRCYERLVEGGTVVEPLATAPWGDTFGMLVDRFGVHWMVNVAGPAASGDPVDEVGEVPLTGQ